MTYDETLRFLYSLEKFGIRFGLENISLTLNLLQNPHQKFKSILIAGTNGKGSTAAMIASILQCAGYKTALYTSPHLQDFRERIRINGVMIPEEDVIELTELIRNRIYNHSELSLTFFEFTTAMAFLYFAREKVDFAVVEVGMGGRLDATNVLNPVLSIITEIDIEHTEHLGEDIKSITREKGGIIKENGITILSSNKTDVVEVIESICKEKNAKLYRIERDFGSRIIEFGMRGSRFEFHNPQSSIRNFEIPLLGRYQIINASTAIKAALILPSLRGGVKIGDSAIYEGLKNVKWQGRLEIVSENPIIILDGAHNPAAAKVLSEELKKFWNSEFGIRINKLILIIGILKDKDYKGIISFLAPIADYIIAVKPKTLRVREPEDLKIESLKYPPPPASPHKWGRNKVGGLMERVEIIEDISEAVLRAKGLASVDDLICITGSFFTVGEARKWVTKMA
ncbi:MAG: bifunctional folylpolyglutamate synthase/dihydrofolate synthase [Nitrospinae bacterium]|nr:bifunctional folylpolyglutamate synthase/dihydrofolate synthase [Nitrospinota bacterium]